MSESASTFNLARLWPPYRRLFRQKLAEGTALIYGRETRIVARAMGYDTQLLVEVVEDAAAQVNAARPIMKKYAPQIRHFLELIRTADTERNHKALEKLRQDRARELERVYQAGKVPLEPRDTYPSRLKLWVQNRRAVLELAETTRSRPT